MTRPVPESGQFEQSVTALAAWKHKALADGQITEMEARELLAISTRMARIGNRIVRAWRFVGKVLTGGQGMDSKCVRIAWDEHQQASAWEEATLTDKQAA